MASPQLENGHTEIANELLEAIIKTPMSDYEHRIFWLIIRKTYGFKKKLDWISQTQIVNGTGIIKQHVSRTIKKLLVKNMITKDGKHLAIQKDYEQWKLPKQVTNITNKSNLNRLSKLPKQVTKVTQTGYKSNLNRGIQKKLYKRNYTKETIQKTYMIKTPYKEIKELYNTICISLPKATVLTSAREKLISTRWKKYNKIEVYEELFNRAEESNFLSGRIDTKSKWVCNFDWLLNETNMVKVLEGNYENRGKE